MNLQQVDTPLKGGMNTPMYESNFDSATPKHQIQQTPNMMITTPFRTPGAEGQGITARICVCYSLFDNHIQHFPNDEWDTLCRKTIFFSDIYSRYKTHA